MLESLVLALLAWIGGNTDYDTAVVRVAPPTIQMVPVETLGPGVLARYRGRPAPTIQLPQGWDAQNLADQATLLHELVHAIQHTNCHWPHDASGCVRDAEAEAYALELRWFEERARRLGRAGYPPPLLNAPG